MFSITRIYTDENGDSRFGYLNIPLNDAGKIGSLSDKYPVKDIIFRVVEPDYDWDFHNAPQKQFLILLDGNIEIESSLGEKKQFGPGDVVLLEDTSGKGHRTKNLLFERRRSVFVTVGEWSIVNSE